VIASGLEKGNQLAFKVHEDTSLVLVPRQVLEGRIESEETLKKECQIFVRLKDDSDSVCRKIVSLYVVGTNLIKVLFKEDSILHKHRVAISNLTKDFLLGSEIINETDNEITIQVLINHPDFSIDQAIRRMAVLALSAEKEAVSAIETVEEKSIQSVSEACNDVNRLNFYVIRQLKYGLESGLYKELGFKTQKEFLGYEVVANDIKSIAENALNLINNIILTKNILKDKLLVLTEPIDKEIFSQILNFNSKARYYLEGALKAFFKRDYKYADKFMSDIDSFINVDSELIKTTFINKIDPNISTVLRLMIDDSRRIIACSQNIGYITLNRTIEEYSTLIS
jgi:phosphate uptake regulator